jgi:F-type H+-transporting ATPase subunit gamma
MVQLIQMRHRIRDIQVVHKITYAMRLIAMSTHSRLKNRERGLLTYVNTLNDIFLNLKVQAPQWHNEILYPTESTGKKLLIVIGSQKGLCGNFNDLIFTHLALELAKIGPTKVHIIALGKKIVDYIQRAKIGPLVHNYKQMSFSTIGAHARSITQEIMLSEGRYEQIIVIANEPKGFFSQVPRSTILAPFLMQEAQQFISDKEQDYVWEQKPGDILSTLIYQCLEANIHNLLFRSLLAEQAARFISMDSSTRNAKTLLETMHLQYNKLRQAKITREVTEISESL